MQNIAIKELTISDYEDVIQLWNACDGIHMHGDYSETLEGLSCFLKRNPGLSFIARDGKVIVGVVLGSQDGRRGFINHLAVSNQYRRNGIGRVLVQKVVEVFKASGIRKILIFVLKDNVSAKVFWNRMGFANEAIIDVQSIVV